MISPIAIFHVKTYQDIRIFLECVLYLNSIFIYPTMSNFTPLWVECKDDTGISIVSTMYYYITSKIVHYCIYVTIKAMTHIPTRPSSRG